MFDELKKGWKDQGTDLPNIDEIKNSINNNRNKLRRQYTFAICALVGTIIVGLILWFNIDFSYWSTLLAFLIMLAAINAGIIYLIYLSQILPKTVDSLKSGQEFTEQWVNYQKKTEEGRSAFAWIYTLTLSLGMALYLYEVTAGSTTFRIFAYSSVTLWTLYVWFVLSPKLKQKSDERIGYVSNFNCKKDIRKIPTAV